jgi:hypothetical protein
LWYNLNLRGVDDLHVTVLVLTVKLLRRWVDSGLVVTQLQESLYSTRRVLGSLTIVSVRQREYQTGSLEPFTFTGSEELINDTLSVVATSSVKESLFMTEGNLREITKLSFPHGQTVWRDERVTKFETKSTEFGKMRVGNSE